MGDRIRVFAPATVANLGPGFDVLGLALREPGDVVEAELSDRPGVQLIDITGDNGLLSRDPQENVATIAAADVLRRTNSSRGVRLWLHKQMPLASGLGSSGASSAAGAVAANELLGRPFAPIDLVCSAMEGERAVSGAPHADNVAPSILGGVVLVRSYQPLDIIALPVPETLHITVVHPHYEVSTIEARALLKARSFPLEPIVANLGNVASLVAGLCNGDMHLIGRSIADQLVEPLRSRLIPGFAAVKDAALSAGGLGCSIAGSGPSMFAISDAPSAADRICEAMRDAFRSAAGLESDVYTGKVSKKGARVVD